MLLTLSWRAQAAILGGQKHEKVADLLLPAPLQFRSP